MDDSVRQSLAHAERLSLTPVEKAASKFALEAHMHLSLSAQEKTDIRRILQHAVYAEPGQSWWTVLRAPLRLPALAAAFILFVGASGGVVVAAEKALPGHFLYGVKVHFNEAVVASFKGTPEERAQWELTRFERRLRELNAISAQGEVNDEIDQELAKTIEDSAYRIEQEPLPADAAERAALRTAVRSALGEDEDSLRRASRVTRVLRALKERADAIEGNTVIPAVLPTTSGRAPSIVPDPLPLPASSAPPQTSSARASVRSSAEAPSSAAAAQSSAEAQMQSSHGSTESPLPLIPPPTIPVDTPDHPLL